MLARPRASKVACMRAVTQGGEGVRVSDGAVRGLLDGALLKVGAAPRQRTRVDPAGQVGFGKYG